MNDSFNRKKEALLSVIGNLNYQKLTLKDFLNVELYLFYKHNLFSTLGTIKYFFRNLLALIYTIIKINIVPQSINKKYIVVLDHNRSEYYDLAMELANKLGLGDTLILTSKLSVYMKLQKYKDTYHITYVNGNLGCTKLKHIELLIKVLKLVKSSFIEKISLMKIIMISMKLIDFYGKNLNNTIKGVVTIVDAHMNERIIALMANQKNIHTYTLQHGDIGEFWLPIVSNTFYVWSEHIKSECTAIHKINDCEIIVAGNPFKDYLVNKKSSSKDFRITYVATNFGTNENEKLFDYFLELFDLTNVELQVKLRPNASRKMIYEYASWLKKKNISSNIILGNISIEEVLENSDLIVTYHSGVPKEAMLYGVPSIILDIFQYINLKNLITHYEDVVVVHSKDEFLSEVLKILSNRQYYNDLSKNTLNNSKKYFYTKSKKESISLVADKILHETI